MNMHFTWIRVCFIIANILLRIDDSSTSHSSSIVLGKRSYFFEFINEINMFTPSESVTLSLVL